MEVEISLASVADIPALCRLLSELFTQEAEFRPDYEAQSRGLTRIIADPNIGHIFVVRRDSQIVGMVNLLYTVSTALGERVAWLEDMVVSSDVRGLGVGSRLLEHAVEFARQNGCRRLSLLTDADNLHAQQFYRRQGFRVSEMVPMRLVF
ncbi:GNAT family N-acetyltransferase [Methylomonas sp. MO1]|uniref:GNAT family N-acetyltransferase n=1 Tax=Methylomonas sp. MO1 TaxID=3073619 RepID=UPI0028A3B7CC|nr:GNAT family N-acetyltransferase [Methylomonas sp. MO1]MDT4289334.1 GNAT family N-acetyltransferase [Methylomonas sp. MO1]